MSERSLPASVIEAFELEGATITPITIGLVNQTFFADRRNHDRIVVQRLHPIFDETVNLDIDAITTHLAARNLTTPRIVRTTRGAPFVVDGGVYRALTFLEGRVHTDVASPNIAFEAGRVAGEFHRAVSDLEHDFHFARPGVHDTAAHMRRLTTALDSVAATHPVIDVGRAIAQSHSQLPPLPTTRRRTLHGDLKITNVLFDPNGERAIALLDLDTMQHGILPIELGDALRSWCNPRGESAADAYYDPSIAEAALEGFLEGASGDVDEEELAAIPLGVATIAIELASRFAVDVVEDRYFGWDPSRFESRAAHNLARARAMLALGRDVIDKTRITK